VALKLQVFLARICPDKEAGDFAGNKAMDNRITPNVPPAPPKQAESSDTRQGIVRHDPEYERRKKKKHNDSEDLFDEAAENPEVSVAALRMFLKDCLDKHGKPAGTKPEPPIQQSHKADSNISGSENAVQSSTPKSCYAAQAANAYAKRAEIDGGSARSQAQPPDSATFSARSPADEITETPQYLSGEEVRLIHRLQDDLKDLEKAQILSIRIELKDSFLHSVEAAVTRAKGQL